MLRIATCDNCKEELGFHVGDESAELTLIIHGEWCDTCHNSNNEKTKYSFCNKKCLKEFINKGN